MTLASPLLIVCLLVPSNPKLFVVCVSVTYKSHYLVEGGYLVYTRSDHAVP